MTALLNKSAQRDFSRLARQAFSRARHFEIRLGIGTRLGIAFAAVAVLAIAAHFFAQGARTIVRTDVTTVPIVVKSKPAETLPPYKNADQLIAALNRFTRAALSRMDTASSESIAELRSASIALDGARADYLHDAAQWMDESKVRKLDTRISAQKNRSERLWKLADQRRATLKEYWDRFEALDSRLKASLDKAWKIFGRIFARQSLIALSRSLDEIRHRFGALTTIGAPDKEAVEAIATSEAAFGAALKQNESGFKKSQGDEWLAGVRADFDQIVALRTKVTSLDDQRRADVQSFYNETTHLAALLNVPPPVRTPIATAPVIQKQTATVLQTNTIQDPPDYTMAWITGGVLVLLLATSIGTVLSVQIPVHRMLAATRRLADGDTSVRVPSGGVKELAILASAFNRMAEQLAIAQAAVRVHHSQLEAKVDERTRQLQHLAEHDPLTRLPNRRQLFAHLEAALRRASQKHHCVAVFFLDLDNFKNINDSMGHEYGDKVLQNIGDRLRAAMGERGFIARLGGDEFTVVCEDAGSLEQIRHTGQLLVKAFADPIEIAGRDLLISASVGASAYPDHAADAHALLRAADAALFRAKELGRTQLNVFSPDLLEAASSRFRLEQGLRRAVERGEFEMVYQPEVDLQTSEVVAVEALLRWRLPEGRLVSPVEFLAVAEQSGLIMEISDWVLRSAVSAAAEWHRTGWSNARVAVNVSSRQLLDNRFVDYLASLLKEHELPTRCIEIELTENVLQTGAATVEALKRLRASGVAIALDDFGTGYSSLASLEQLPLTRVKLDRSLIAGLGSSPRATAISRGIISLCRDLGLQVTAEGIEHTEQLAALSQYNTLTLQGYLISRPLNREAVLPFISGASEHMNSLLLSMNEIMYEERVLEELTRLAVPHSA